MQITIRKENQSDYSDVFNLNKVAFEQDAESKLIDLLRKGLAFIPELSIVAETNDEIVGHILFTKIKIKAENGNEYSSLALAPMSVTPKFQSKGIGGKLIKHGLNTAKELGYESVIVLGHKDYYPKFGFKVASLWNIKAPFEVPDEAFMAIELVENGLEGISGIVKYSKEFDELE